jgi:hypothetical protein
VCFRHGGEPSKVGAFASRHLRFKDCRATALSKKRSNLIIRALRPFVGLRQPKCSATGVEQGALSAHHFLIANFGKLVDLPSLPKREAILPAQHNRALTDSFSIFRCKNGWLFLLKYLLLPGDGRRLREVTL